MDKHFNWGTEEIEMLDTISKAFQAKGKKEMVLLNNGGVS